MHFNQTSSPVYSPNEINSLCQQYLIHIYADLEKQDIANITQNHIIETYGEILYPSIDKIIASISLNEQDIFIDFGSGKGQIVTQFFLKSLVKEAYGIEILPELHRVALSSAERIQNELPDFFHNERKLSFLLGSFIDIPFTTASVILVSSTCFTQSLLNELGQLIENTPGIHTVLSLRPMITLKRLAFLKAIRIECSWDSALCYIYTSHR